MKRKIRVGLLFGGRSGEHEVSLASASAVLESLDRDKYEPVLLGITREGRWLMGNSPEALQRGEVTPELPGTVEATVDVTQHSVMRLDHQGKRGEAENAVDIVFPLLHGPHGEDGTVQGLFELADIPYVGSGVLGSSVSMDKVMMKNVFRSAGIPTPRSVLVRAREWERQPGGIAGRVASEIGYPCFVKPCNLGSSVGIAKVHTSEELNPAMERALRYDRRIIVEEAIEGREVECSVLGNDDPMVSVPGEIVSRHEFYDYDAKYTEGLADLIIPAKLKKETVAELQRLAREAFLAVDASGLARVDFFIRKDDGQLLVNEINTIPGFTQHSMYPKLWEATGVPFSEVVDRLIQLALDRHEEKLQHFDSRK